MAVLPENMDKLNPEDTRQSFSILENYIRYMGERIEFAMRNVTRNVTAAGVSSAEIYVLLTALNHELSALKSTVNTQTGSITGILKTLGEIEAAVETLEKIVPISHEWEGTVLKVTSNSGTTSADLKGPKGDNGDDYVLTEADKQEIANLAGSGSAGIKSEIVMLSNVPLTKGALLENQIITFPTQHCTADNYICKFLISSWPKQTWADAYVFNVHSDCTTVIGTPGTLFAFNQFGLATMATQQYDLIAQFIYYDK